MSNGTQRNANIIRRAIAVLLFSAAILKSHQLATHPIAPQQIISSRSIMVAVVQLELILATWLAIGWKKRVLWLVTIACFITFLSLASYQALTGAQSCSCFGVFSVSPWATVGIDACVLASLVLTHTEWRDQHVRSLDGPIWLGAVSYLVMGSTTAVWAASYSARLLSAEGVIVGDEGLVVLRPAEWIGEQFPLVEFVSDSTRLTQDDWQVLLYRHDCKLCEDACLNFFDLRASGRWSKSRRLGNRSLNPTA